MKRFKKTTVSNWTDRDGSRGTQVETLMCRVVRCDSEWIEYEVVEVESVENPPSFYIPPTGSKGGIKRKFLHLMPNIEVLA